MFRIEISLSIIVIVTVLQIIIIGKIIFSNNTQKVRGWILLFLLIWVFEMSMPFAEQKMVNTYGELKKESTSISNITKNDNAGVLIVDKKGFGHYRIKFSDIHKSAKNESYVLLRTFQGGSVVQGIYLNSADLDSLGFDIISK